MCEDLMMTLPELARKMEKDGGPVIRCGSTLTRWSERGVLTAEGRVKLKVKRIGNRRHSTVEWVRDFLARL